MTKETDALRDLYTTLIDSRDGYEQAAEIVDSPKLQNLFEDMRGRRAQHAAEVREFLASSESDLDDDGTILAAAHRQFLGLKDMLSSDDEEVVEEVIRGERTLMEAYDKAIVPMDANSPAYTFANKQYDSVKARIAKLEEIERQLD
jgi:uncharacterized protein (TIGR02284 family)